MIVKILFKKFLFIALMFILVSTMVNAAASTIFNPDRDREESDSTYSFIDSEQWKDRKLFSDKWTDRNWYSDNVVHSLWDTHYDDDGLVAYNKMDFTKDFWQPIESWEYDVCSQGLSTNLEYKPIGASIGGSIYATTVTLSASQLYVSERNDSYLYEVSWYVHPKGTIGDYYTINLIGTNIDDVLKEKTGAGQIRGDQGYIAFYATRNYTNVRLVYANEPYEFIIVPKVDINRELTARN